MSKPGKSLKELCKKLGVRLTVKRGKKRVYKSVAVLKGKCANKKSKKKKKVKRRRKFGLKSTINEDSINDLISLPKNDRQNYLDSIKDEQLKKKVMKLFFCLDKLQIEDSINELISKPKKDRQNYLDSIQDEQLKKKVVKLLLDKLQILDKLSKLNEYFLSLYFLSDQNSKRQNEILKLHKKLNNSTTTFLKENSEKSPEDLEILMIQFFFSKISTMEKIVDLLKAENVVSKPSEQATLLKELGIKRIEKLEEVKQRLLPNFGKRNKMKKEKISSSLKKLCKKHGVRLTVKRGKKRVYKSVKVLKDQCDRKRKVVKRKRRRRKFGTGTPERGRPDSVETPRTTERNARTPGYWNSPPGWLPNSPGDFPSPMMSPIQGPPSVRVNLGPRRLFDSDSESESDSDEEDDRRLPVNRQLFRFAKKKKVKKRRKVVKKKKRVKRKSKK